MEVSPSVNQPTHSKRPSTRLLPRPLHQDTLDSKQSDAAVVQAVAKTSGWNWNTSWNDWTGNPPEVFRLMDYQVFLLVCESFRLYHSTHGSTPGITFLR